MHKLNFNLTTFFRLIAIALVLSFVFSQFFTKISQAAIGINRQINFQGKLVNNPLSTNVSNTSYTIVFTLYDDPDAGQGTVLWQESQSVTTVDGIFRVALGSVTPFPANFNFNWDGLYLGIKVNADSEMTPRIQMAAVPFAFNAEKVAGLTVQDTSGNASTSGTLQVGNGKTITFADNISFGTGTTGTISLGTGSNTLSLQTTGNTTLTLPQSGTLCTTASCALSNWWNQLAGALTPLNSTNDFLLGSSSTSSALFSYTGIKTGQTIASVSGSLIVMPNNGYGNVGIGTTNPTAKLDIASGAIRLGGGTNAIRLTNDTQALYAGLDVQSDVNNTGTIVRIFPKGTAGTQPSSNLQIFNTDWISSQTNYESLEFRYFNNVAQLLSSAGGSGTVRPIQITTGSNTGLNLDIAGNVGIGTNSPNRIASTASATLTLETSTVGINGNSPTVELSRARGTFENNSEIGVIRFMAGTSPVQLAAINSNMLGTVANDANLQFFTTPTGGSITQRMIINKDGYVGIGTSLPQGFTHINGGNANNAALIVNNLNNGNLFAASASGTTKFTISNGGLLSVLGGLSSDIDTLSATTLKIGTSTTNAVTLGNNTVTSITMNVDTAGNFVFQKEGASFTCSGTDKLTLNGSGQLICDTDQTGGGTGVNWWNQLAGALSPVSINDDFLIGGTATSTAKFSYTGIQSGNTIASVSGSLIVMPNNGYGNVGINTTTPRQKLQVVGNLEVGAAASGAKSYRFRSSGGALDFEGSGADMYFTMWSAADFTGTQEFYLMLNSDTHIANAHGDWIFQTGNTGGGGDTVLAVNGDSTGAVGVRTGSPNATFHVIGQYGSNASVIVDQLNSGDLFTASASGVTMFRLANNGDAEFTGTLSDTNSNLILNDTVDLFSTTTGLRVGTDGDLSDIDDTAIVVSDGLTVSGAIAANGGITFDQSTDTLGAHTMAGNIIGGSFIITDIGSTGTDFDTSGGLNITTDAAGTALTVDNAGNASSIFVAEDNNSPVFTIADGGNITLTGTITDSNSDVDITDGLIVDSLTIDTADITWSGTTPTITINAAETFTISNGTAADNFVYNTSTNALTIGDGTNGLTFDIDTGMTYQGSGRPTKKITLNAEYPGAILTASGSANFNGSMTSDASPSAALSNWRTYYEWSSSQTSLQDYTVVVRVKLPEDFGAWSLTNALTISYNTELPGNGSNKMDVVIYNADTSLTAQEQSTPVVVRTANTSATAKTWLDLSIDDSDLNDNGNALNTAGDTAVIYIKMYSKDDNHVQIGDITLSYLSIF